MKRETENGGHRAQWLITQSKLVIPGGIPAPRIPGDAVNPTLEKLPKLPTIEVKEPRLGAQKEFRMANERTSFIGNLLGGKLGEILTLDSTQKPLESP
jgi:hypothetical protein